MAAEGMHPDNVFRTKPDFMKLADKYPDFRKHCSFNLKNKLRYDFKSPGALKVLSETLLREYFDITVHIPTNKLIPTIPLRMNYILWIRDLLNTLPESCTCGGIRGLDIGVGSCAIYMLLGCKLFDWTFLGVDTDQENISSSQQSISVNKMDDRLSLKHVDNGYALGLIPELSQGEFTFCMSNPPFFDTADNHDDSSEADCERATPGGELAVLKTLIEHSVSLRTRVKWYTALVGIKKNIVNLKEILRCVDGITKVLTTSFCQGKTFRWGIAWTFQPDLRDCHISRARSTKAVKKRGPIELRMDLADFTELGALPKNIDKFGVLSTYIKDVLAKLDDCGLESVSEIPCCSKLNFTAASCSWAGSRKKRRELKRLQLQQEQSGSTPKRPHADSDDEDDDSPPVDVKRRRLQLDEDDEESSSISPKSRNGDDLMEVEVSSKPDSGIGNDSRSPSVTGTCEQNGDSCEQSDAQSAAALSCSIVLKLEKEQIHIILSSRFHHQRENLNSLMLYVKGCLQRYSRGEVKT